ncbi:MAG: glycosyltransferase [Chloroflexi bacterium]|nr:glycosyltransferase [Chloroflexota bacterium]
MVESMRIAVVGIRGVPANFGGSETAVEEIGARLVARGHQVTVYCREHHDSLHGHRDYKGMRRVVLPSLNTLNLDLMSHSFLCLLHMAREEFDIVHFHGVGNALLLPLFRLTGRRAKSLLVVDGPDWRRPKWGRMARLAFKASFPMAARMADEIISDNIQVQELFLKNYGRGTPLVGYGADLNRPSTYGALQKQGLEAGKYILQVGALVPDKGAHVLVEAYKQIRTDWPLVIVGDSPYATAYKAAVRSTKDSRIRFLGYVYGLEYRELLANCGLYIHPLLVDGTSPALLQAMAYGCCIIASDLPEIDGTLADTGPRFRTGDANSLREQIALMLDHPDRARQFGEKARSRVIAYFDWDQVTNQYEQLSRELCGLSSSPGLMHAA